MQKTKILLGLMASAICLGLAPLFMPESYSWISNTTSESAAQSLQNAWVARLGFVLYGLSVIALCGLKQNTWSKWAIKFHYIFGVMIIMAAAFSIKHWEANILFDHFEDNLHSIAASVMGFAYSLGILALLLTQKRSINHKVFDIFAIASSIIIPLMMLRSAEYSGLVQRLMFAISFTWYAKETLKSD